MDRRLAAILVADIAGFSACAALPEHAGRTRRQTSDVTHRIVASSSLTEITLCPIEAS